MSKRLGLKKWTACCVVIALALTTVYAQQPPEQKPPMPLATAWANVVAACKAAQLDVLTGRQGVAVDESLRRLQPVLAAYDVYAVDIEKLIAEKKAADAPAVEVKAEAE